MEKTDNVEKLALVLNWLVRGKNEMQRIKNERQRIGDAWW